MSRTKDTTESHLRKRRSIFQKAMYELENSSISFKRRHVIETMHNQGYSDYTIDKYYVDWAYMSRENTFVRSLAEGAYSRVIQDIYSKLVEYQELVSDWQKNPPKIYRQIAESKKSGEDPRVTRSVITTISPIAIANLDLKITQLLLSLVKGDVIDTSFALVQDEMESLRKLVENKTCL